MLKLPKGLKKKKKGKKSKKDKELFTEEELEQYRRDHQQQRPADASGEQLSTTSDVEQSSTAEDNYQSSKPEGGADDDEWSRFNALATGVDSILKKTQGDLDRIKSTSFFQRVLPPSEKKKAQQLALEQEEEEEAATKIKLEQQAKEAEETKDELAGAVIELSESESESEAVDDIFDTTYIDVITTNELPLAYVPESPTEDTSEGPDPFDTTYADKIIKGPEVSKKGKKLVSIGSAVEVLTGRVESTTTVVSRRPRRGPKDLLLDNFDDTVAEVVETTCESERVVIKTLLDDPADTLPDIPIDLSVSLHLNLQKEQQEQQKQEAEKQTEVEKSIVVQFDVIKPTDEDDEFALLAVESITKKDDIVITDPKDSQLTEFSSEWSAFNEQLVTDENKSSKPVRPPPVRPVTGPKIPYVVSDEDLGILNNDEGVDPFDTAFVKRIIPTIEDDEDFDFDPRAEEKVINPIDQEELFSPDFPTERQLVPQRDLLGGSTSDLSQLPEVEIAPAAVKTNDSDIDPFDTSAVTSIVAPGKIELKFLEKELLNDQTTILKHSLSDPDFDPRANDIETEVHQTTAERKSSLSLNIHSSVSKSVCFAVHTPDLLAVGNDGGKIQKPLTPYYSKGPVIIEGTSEDDPFDTSFVSDIKPTQVELNLIERDLLSETNIKHSVSDNDFDPRAVTPEINPTEVITQVKSDLLAVDDEHNIKVLTPAVEERYQAPAFIDPFDTSSIASNILPGRAELKLIENELLPGKELSEPVFDILSFSQDDSLPVKALTPQGIGDIVDEIEDIDPFDTSFAENLGPGKTEIKLLETELIDRK